MDKMKQKNQTILKVMSWLIVLVVYFSIPYLPTYAQGMPSDGLIAVSNLGGIIDFKNLAPQIADTQNSQAYYNKAILPAILTSFEFPEIPMETDNIIGGGDERIQRMDTTVYPWSTVVKIEGNFGEFSMGCTGWMLGPSTVATSAHCIYDHDVHVFGTNVEIIPALNTDAENSEPFGRCKAVIAWIPSLWFSSGNDQYDYGVYGLNCRVGEQTGNLGYQILADNLLLNTLVNVTGYPAVKGGTTMWYGLGGVSGFSQNFVEYQNDTSLGQSGAPVWEFINDGCENCVTAIHHGGVPTFNYGVRINQDVFDFLFVMQQWVYNPIFLPIILLPGNNQDPNTPEAYPAPAELSGRNDTMDDIYPAP